MNHLPLLTLLICIPLAGGIVVAFIGAGRPVLAKRLAYGFAAVSLLVAIWAIVNEGLPSRSLILIGRSLLSLILKVTTGFLSLPIMTLVMSALSPAPGT